MSERFTRLFTMPAEQYAEGSPLLIAAGALLRDNQSNKLLAQLKLKNLDARAIRAVQIRLWPEDAFGHAAENPVFYSYLDLNADRGWVFGFKNPIPLSDPSTRSFRAEICAVAFADGSRWIAPEGAVWASLPAGESLEAALGDPELCKQLRLARGADCRFLPTRHGELWRCACGEAVKGETCPACGKGFFEIDLAALTEAKDKRLAEEKAAAEKAAAEAAERARLEAEKARLEAEKAEKLAREKAEKVEKAKVKRKKAGKILGITVPAALLVAAAILLGIPGLSAIQAKKAADAGDYIGAVEKYRSAAGWDLFENLFHPGDKAEALGPAARYQEGEAALAEGRYAEAVAAFGRAGDYRDARTRSRELWNTLAVRESVSAGMYHTVGLKVDGTVVAAGSDYDESCRVSGWTDIVAVSAGQQYTVGLKADGTVVAVGNNYEGRCDVSDWTDIVAVSAGENHTVGLKADGTVVAVGKKEYGRCDVSDWTDIVAVSAGGGHTVGLKADGTVVAVGANMFGQCDVSGWTDIVAVSAGWSQTVGLRADGTVVVAVEWFDLDGVSTTDVSDWTDIVAVSAGGGHIVGLRADGTVVAVGLNTDGECDVSGWTDIVAISAGNVHTVGLKADGTVVAVGNGGWGNCDVSDWTGIKIPN